MRRRSSFVVAVCTAVLMASSGMAGAHPSRGDETEAAGSLLVDPFDRSLILDAFGAADPATIAPTEGTTSIAGMTLVGNSDRDGTINSDLAFWGDLAYAGM